MSQNKTLLVIVRGWCDSEDFFLKHLFKQPGGEFPHEFISSITSELKHVEILQPTLEMDMFSMRTAESLAQNIYDQIESKLSQSNDISNIILLGFSAGSALVRRVFTMAHGANRDASIDESKKAGWANKISRTIILSGITRGWEISSATPTIIRFLAPIFEFIIRCVGLFKQRKCPKTSDFSRTPFIMQLQRGAPFIISTRLQYLAAFKHLIAKQKQLDKVNIDENRMDLPFTVFILGSRDEFISPVDCTELGPRSEFIYFELPGSNHMDALKIYESGDISKKRRICLLNVISKSFQELCVDPDVVLPNDIDDYLDPMDISNIKESDQDLSRVKDVVMVIHGIRDNGFWTKRVAREIRKLRRKDGDSLSVRVATPSYGFFSMLDFLINRDKATYWFLEKYAEVKSYYPEAQISFIGHSNGTYLAARALHLCEAVRFKNVIFAGSVVRRDYWQELANTTNLQMRVSKILNYIAAGDNVVAWLPGAFERLHFSLLNLGGAGAYGFNEIKDVEILNQIKYIGGGHSAAVSEEYWQELANFVITGEYPSTKTIERNWWKKIQYFGAPIITFGFAVIVLLPLLIFALWFPIFKLADLERWNNFSLLILLFLSISVSWLTLKILNKF